MSNKLAKAVQSLQSVPSFARVWATSKAFGSQVKFAGTAGVRFESLTPTEVVCTIANTRKVQNHIAGVHAAAMALLAETATGFVVGMNVPDDKLPLLKSMEIEYVKRASGGLRAVARLTQEQIQDIKGSPKGSVSVPVTVTDEEGKEPIQAKFVWAWVSKQPKEVKSKL